MSDDTAPTGHRRPLRYPEKRERPLMLVLYGLEYALFASVMGLFRILGVNRASDLGGWLARTLGPRIPVTRRARRNMTAAMPELTEAQREAYIVDMWESLGRTFGEYAHIDRINSNGVDPRVEIVGQEHAKDAIAKGKGGLFVSGHCGNWELMPPCINALGLKGILVYRPQNNPFVDAWISKQRALGLPGLAAKGGDGARSIIKTLREGKFIAMLVDQKMNEGISVPLFGRECMTPTGAPSLALRNGSPIVPAWCERLPGPRFRVTIYPAILFPNTGDRDKDVYEMALSLNRFIEDRVRENPANWLWLHNRWPKK